MAIRVATASQRNGFVSGNWQLENGKAAVPKNKKRRRKKKKKKAPDEPADEEYDPEKYAEEGDEVLGSDSEDESGC